MLFLWIPNETKQLSGSIAEPARANGETSRYLAPTWTHSVKWHHHIYTSRRRRPRVVVRKQTVVNHFGYSGVCRYVFQGSVIENLHLKQIRNCWKLSQKSFSHSRWSVCFQSLLLVSFSSRRWAATSNRAVVSWQDRNKLIALEWLCEGVTWMLP